MVLGGPGLSLNVLTIKGFKNVMNYLSHQSCFADWFNFCQCFTVKVSPIFSMCFFSCVCACAP